MRTEKLLRTHLDKVFWPMEDTRGLAKIVARLVHTRLPKLTSIERNPRKRRYAIFKDVPEARYVP